MNNNTNVTEDLHGTTTDSEGFSEFTLDPCHPFYVHPSDSPCSQLVTIPFNGAGFIIWRSSMLTSLSAKNKLGLVTGRIPQPQPDSPFWDRCNNMVKAWITNSLTREIVVSVMCFNTASKVWRDINDRYSQSNGSKYIQIHRKISSTSQETYDITTYFTRMRSLWDELNSSYVEPTCSCGALPKFIEDQHLFQFLGGLNESYSTVKSSILMMSPYPRISKAYSLLQQDESQKKTKSIALGFSADSAASFSASSCISSSTNRPHNQRVNFESKKSTSLVTFKYCKKPGHSVEKRYRLHGFLAGFKFTKSRRSAACVQVGDSSPRNLIATGTSNNSLDSAYGFSKEQYEHLMTLFQQANISSGYPQSTSPGENIGFANFAGMCNLPVNQFLAVNSVMHSLFAQLGRIPWILHSGAINHMTHHKHVLHNIKLLPSPYLITLPNGYKVKVISTGSLHLRQDITLHNVLLPLEIGKAAHGLYFLLPDMVTPSFSSNAFILLFVIHLQQRLPSSVLTNATPFEKLHGTSPTYDHLKLFDYLCFATTHKSGKDKFQDVVFHEQIFPYSSAPSSSVFPFYSDSFEDPPSFHSSTAHLLTPPDDISVVPHESHPDPSTSSSHHQEPHVIPVSSSVSPPLNAHVPLSNTFLVRHSTRVSNPFSYLSDYVCSSVLSANTVSINSKVFTTELQLQEPQYYQQATSHPAWQEAMLKEFQALEFNHTWDIVPLSPHKKSIPYKWVYKIK
ncbi:uncharacterized protein [Nicotiana tomentosiformis]|uniref:uncharacterized protein n=1 Tax=Nicotiana tomentosiformis TaxID=4098 RepID=UPI00388CD93F